MLSLLIAGALQGAPAVEAPDDRTLSVRPFFSLGALEFEVAAESGETLRYAPNSPLNLGLALAYGGFGGSVSFAVDRLEDEDTHGETDAFDWSLYWYGEHWAVDFYLQRYDGLFAELGEDACERAPTADCVLQPDAGVSRLGATVAYLFDPAFSLRAAFVQSAWQRASAGSWLVLASADRVRFVVQDDDGVALTGGTLGGGYGHLWVSDGGWFVAPVVLLGLGPMYAEGVDEGWHLGHKVRSRSGHRSAASSGRARASDRLIAPPEGIAAAALATRLTTACSTCPRSTQTDSGPSCGASSSSMSARTRRRSIGIRPVTTSPRSKVRRSRCCRRPKVKSWAVSSAAFCVQSAMPCRNSAASLSGCGSRSISSSWV